MPGLLQTVAGREYRLLYTAASGREYMVVLTAMGEYHDEPPFCVTERDDGFLVATERTYSSMDHLASEHGCVVKSFESVDPPN